MFSFCTNILLEAVNLSGTYLVWIQSTFFWNVNWTYDYLTFLISIAFTNYIILLVSLVVLSVMLYSVLRMLALTWPVVLQEKGQPP
jgi:hypothetical protein